MQYSANMVNKVAKDESNNRKLKLDSMLQIIIILALIQQYPISLEKGLICQKQFTK